MARNVATTIENNFVLGLITERTELRFPQNAATDMNNCIVDLYGRVTRRLGMDLEENYSALSLSPADYTTTAYSEYLWEGANGDSNSTFLVQQHGNTLSFFDLSNTLDIGPSFLQSTINLASFVPSGSTNSPSTQLCQYTSGNGVLIVTNPYINPIRVEYSSGAFTATAINLKIRDFEGLDDGLDLTERPTSSVAALITGNPEHYYNLLNQGWFSGDALTQWDTARTDVPSNADIVGLYRASATDAFDNGIVSSKSPGNIFAPKGHFILDAFTKDRAAAALAEGYTIGFGTPTLANMAGTNIGNFSSADSVFDGNTSNWGVSPDSNLGWVGRNISSSPVAGAYVTMTGQDLGAKPVIKLYGSNSNPSSSTDGTELGSLSISNTATSAFIGSSNPTTPYTYVWIRISTNSGQYKRVNEVQVYSSLGDAVTISDERPATCAFFNQRVFYAGTKALDQSSRIYFSRIVEIDSHYGQCYSDNDPTAEELNDFLPSDGGVIVIPEAGLITKIVPAKSSLLVLSVNGVWLISGTSTGPFSAVNYQVRKLSSIGCQCPQSVVDYKGTPIWWADDGIYTVQYDPNYDSFAIVSLTEDSIRSFYNAIPISNRKFVKGAYHIETDVIYWLYSDQEPNEILCSYNKVLNYRPRSKAFYPWTFPEDPVSLRGICYVRDASRNYSPEIIFPATSNSGTSLYYASVSSHTYKDWSTYAQVVTADQDDEIDYTSTFETGYYIHGETQKYFQGNYLFVFLDQDTLGSCWAQTKYDWSLSGNSGKWGSQQQVYPDWQLLQKVNYRRLKTRGKGKSMQLSFWSESGKPFSIIGWSIWESGNANI